jgi:hypothetical protein
MLLPCFLRNAISLTFGGRALLPIRMLAPPIVEVLLMRVGCGEYGEIKGGPTVLVQHKNVELSLPTLRSF